MPGQRGRSRACERNPPSHGECGAAQERERRDQHSPIADWHEVLNARLALFDQQCHRVWPIGRRRPVPERAERYLASDGAAQLSVCSGGIAIDRPTTDTVKRKGRRASSGAPILLLFWDRSLFDSSRA